MLWHLTEPPVLRLYSITAVSGAASTSTIALYTAQPSVHSVSTNIHTWGDSAVYSGANINQAWYNNIMARMTVDGRVSCSNI